MMQVLVLHCWMLSGREEILYCYLPDNLLQLMRKLLVLVILLVVFTFGIVSSSSSMNIAYAYVDITSPSEGQQIPVGTPMIIKGISTSATNESNHCTVSVIINSIFPYHKATPIGSNGTRDYTSWQFIGNQSYGIVKLGQNKITGKYSCFPNTDTSNTQPDFVKHHSVNIIGIAANNNNKSLATVKPVSSNTSARYVSNESKPKTLLISYKLENPVTSGSNQTIETTVHNGSNVTIAEARVNGTVMNSANTPVTNFTGITNQSGIFSYTWKIDKAYKSGPFTVGLYASANGYQHQLTPTTAVFNVTSAEVHKSDPGGHKSSHHNSSSSSDSGSSSSNHHHSSSGSSSSDHHSSKSEHHTPSSDHHSSSSDSSSSNHSHPLSIIHIPHIHFPHIHTPKLPFS